MTGKVLTPETLVREPEKSLKMNEKPKYRIRNRSSNFKQAPEPKPEPKPIILSTFQDYDQFIDDPKNSINLFTTKYEDAPTWYGAEGYIIHGYRRVTNSWRGCFLSLLYLHNETGNVYTHLIGFLLLFPIIFVLLFDWMESVESTIIWDYFANLGFIAGLMACLGFSSLFHLSACHSRQVSLRCNKADYIGIVCLIV
jgi:adiponectin receptor